MPTLSAQISLYPLRQAALSEPIDDLLRLLRERGLDVRPGVMSTLVRGDTHEVFQALEQAFERAGRRGSVVMVATFSNACPVETGQDPTVAV